MRLLSEWVYNNNTLSFTKRLSGTYNGSMNVAMIAQSKCCDYWDFKSSLLVLTHFGYYFLDFIFFQQKSFIALKHLTIPFLVIFCVLCFRTCGCLLHCYKDEKMNITLTVTIKLTIRLEMKGNHKSDKICWRNIMSNLINPYKIRSVKISSFSWALRVKLFLGQE